MPDKHYPTTFDALFEYRAKTEGLRYPWQVLKAIAAIESNFDPDARGQTNDLGLMQFTVPTWKDVMGGVPYEQATNPDLAVQAAARLLVRLETQILGYLERFQKRASDIERIRMVIAAYNCGPGYVKHAIRLVPRDEDLPRTTVTWAQVAEKLLSPGCVVRNRRPSPTVIEHVSRFRIAFRNALDDSGEFMQMLKWEHIQTQEKEA
ncbi:lytic transglycosylase domain-containing protein [bacterium]|nr:lytic transglycosylase domain-containing protein [bacterium]